MITPGQYGFGTQTMSAYYWLGVTNNSAKFRFAGPTVSAGFLAGIAGSYTGSNLPFSPLTVYSNVTSINRFSPLLQGLIKNFVGIKGGKPVVFPGSLATTWQPWL